MNEKNLKPFKKGKDPRRNTGGAPKKIPALDTLLENVPEADYQKIINKIVSKAKTGNIRAAEVVLDRAYGKPKQSLDLGGHLTLPITGMVVRNPNEKK